MKPYIHDITRPLQWQRNKAPRIHRMLRLKDDWYVQFHTQFWRRWHQRTFSLVTADSFGLLVWCFILDVPSQAFVLFPGNTFFEYGDKRQNYDIKNPIDPYTEWRGGNYFGGDDTTILTPIEAKRALRLRYYALISNGTVPFINAALDDVFGPGVAWVEDPQDMTLVYHFTPGSVSAVFVNAVQRYNMIPKVSGVKTIIQFT